MTRSTTRNMSRRQSSADMRFVPVPRYKLVRLTPCLALALAVLPTAGTKAQSAPQNQQTCVDVKLGTAQSYDCLNQQLSQMAHQATRPSSQDAPYSATSPGNVTGQFNESATRDRLGTNFGKSVTPERPAATIPPALSRPR